MSPSNGKLILLTAVALVALSACGDGAAVQATLGKPWVKETECSWWLSGDDGKSLRASIAQGEDGLILSLSDPVFRTWSEEDRPRVELRFNKDAGRRIETEGWATHGGGPSAIFGLYLSEQALGMMDRATTLELRRDGALVVELPLVDTPSQADLQACIPPPPTESSDSE